MHSPRAWPAQDERAVNRDEMVLSATQRRILPHDAIGNRDTVTMPNGVVTNYDYDALNRLDLETVTQAGGTLLATYDYVLRADGTRDASTETVRNDDGSYGTTSIDWAYDALSRLTGETYDAPGTAADYSAVYAMDVVGTGWRSRRPTAAAPRTSPTPRTPTTSSRPRPPRAAPRACTTSATTTTPTAA